MQKCWITLRTDKKKRGSVTYYVPIPTLSHEVDIKDEDKELMKKFAETVKAHNQNVLEQSRESEKLQVVESDDSLADDFNVLCSLKFKTSWNVQVGGKLVFPPKPF